MDKLDILKVMHVGDSGPHIVFLHGLMGRGRNFSTAAKALTPQFQSWLVDLPNHGESPWTEGFSYLEMAQAVAATITQITGAGGVAGGTAPGEPGELGHPTQQPGRVHLLGHSMGGKVAMALALIHPQLVDKLVIEDISPVKGGDVSEFVHLLGALRGLDLGLLESRSQAEVALTEPIPSPTVRGFLLQNLRRVGDTFEWQPNLEMLYNNLSVIGDFPDIDATYSGDVLWMVGEKSPHGDPKFEPGMRALFPHTRRLVVKGAGHWVHSEQPQVFVESVRAFLE